MSVGNKESLDATLFLDFETRSACDLVKAGSHLYSEHPTTDILCLAWVIGVEDEPQLWLPGQPVPERAAEHIRSGGLVRGFNAGLFERLIFREIAGPRYGWPVPQLEQYRDTMIEALAQALPGKLEKVPPAVGLDIKKDDVGNRLMKQVSRPRKLDKDCPLCDGTGVAANETCPCVVWWEDPDRMQRLGEYCLQDVRVERAVAQRVARLRKEELELWFIDQRINDRGIQVDVEVCEAAKVVAAAADKTIAERMKQVTCFEVSGGSDVRGLMRFCEFRGVPIESLAKDQAEELLGDPDLPDDVYEAIQLRLDYAKTSVAKVDALLRGSNAEGRSRGLLQFTAASTGRWCLAAGSKVPVLRGDDVIEVAIEDVTGDDFVWDGENWVEHAGVVSCGEKDVITYDGLTATEDHYVYINENEMVPLGVAAARGDKLWRGREVTW